MTNRNHQSKRRAGIIQGEGGTGYLLRIACHIPFAALQSPQNSTVSALSTHPSPVPLQLNNPVPLGAELSPCDPPPTAEHFTAEGIGLA